MMLNILNHIQHQYDNDPVAIWMSITIIDITMVVITEVMASKDIIVRVWVMSMVVQWAHYRVVKVMNHKNNGIGWRMYLPNQVGTRKRYVQIYIFFSENIFYALFRSCIFTYNCFVTFYLKKINFSTILHLSGYIIRFIYHAHRCTVRNVRTNKDQYWKLLKKKKRK